MPGPPPGAPGPETGHDSDAAPTLFTAVQEQLGLRLDSRKAPVDYFIPGCPPAADGVRK